MVCIGLLQMDFLVYDAQSLKAKRRVIKGLKDRLRNKFNCSIAETDFMDMWNRAQLCVCVVSNERRHANTQLNEIVKAAESVDGAEMTDYRIEML